MVDLKDCEGGSGGSGQTQGYGDGIVGVAHDRVIEVTGPPSVTVAIDASNRFAVGTTGKEVVILGLSARHLTKDDARSLVAWVSVLAGITPEEYAADVAAVEDT